jgi:hypothetical protein
MLSQYLPRARARGVRSRAAIARTARVTQLCGLLAMALAVAAAMADGAAAKVVTDSLTHQKLGVVPSIAGSGIAAKPISTSCTTDCTALVYHNNAPVQHAEKDYLLFWTPSGHAIPYAYRSGLANWLTEVAAKDYTGGNEFSVTQQYYDLSGPSGARQFTGYAITNGGSLVDTDAYPASGCSDKDAYGNPLPICLTQAQIAAEVAKYIAVKGLPTGLGVQHYVFTPVGVGSCFDSTSATCSYTGYCAWHAYQASNSMLYADMPWAYSVNGCDVDVAFGTGYSNGDAIDPEVGVLSHEMAETMTDPELNAWFDGSGNEIGDKCAYTYGSGGYGSTSGLANNGLGYWNTAFGTDDYLLQQEFDNHTSNCQLKSSFTQPNASLSPSTATHGVPQTFTATVTDPYGVAYIAWTFGDGTSATTTGTSVSHTYAAAGTKTLTAIVTDNFGNTKKVSLAVTVS